MSAASAAPTTTGTTATWTTATWTTATRATTAGTAMTRTTARGPVAPGAIATVVEATRGGSSTAGASFLRLRACVLVRRLGLLRGVAALGAESFELLRRQVSPPPDRERAEQHVHEPHALQRHDLVAERFAHPPDLAVEPLREDDREQLRPHRADLAALRHALGPEPDAGAHSLAADFAERM